MSFLDKFKWDGYDVETALNVWTSWNLKKLYIHITLILLLFVLHWILYDDYVDCFFLFFFTSSLCILYTVLKIGTICHAWEWELAFTGLAGIYYVGQTCEIHQVLPYSVDFKAPSE